MSAAEITGDERAARTASAPILGMVLFVASESMFFAALFGAYFTLYASATVWPPLAIPIPSVTLPSIATALLVASGFTMQGAVVAIRRGRTRALNRWLAITILLGVAFLVLQIYDYAHKGFGIHDGVYASLFYVMTGLHTAHVIGGLVFLGIVLAQSWTSQLSLERHEPVEAASIYWHFVDVVWVGLFVIFYVLVQY